MSLRVLVTGASGFAGTQIARHLADQGLQVVAVLGPRAAAPNAMIADLATTTCDLAHGAAGLPPDIDAVVHAAARPAWPGTSVDDMVRDNVVATRNLIAYARRTGVRSFILFSSLSVHGKVEVPVVDEHTPIVDPDAYGLSKRLCELMLADGIGDSLRGLAVRLPGVLGPGSVRNWITTSLVAARQGGDVRVANPAAPFNNAVHVADLAHFIATTITREWTGFEALPLGAGGQTTAGEAACLLAVAGGRGGQAVVGGPARRGYIISSARAITAYGYAPMDITAMLHRFVGENP